MSTFQSQMLRALHFDILISLCPASSLFQTQHQLTYLGKRAQPFVSVFILCCVGSLWISTQPILLINSLLPNLPTVVFFYGERPLLSKIYYFVIGLFLSRETAAIRKILFYMWSISIANNRPYPKYVTLHVAKFYIAKNRRLRSIAQDLGGISLI